jgi:hypothetical protein
MEATTCFAVGQTVLVRFGGYVGRSGRCPQWRRGVVKSVQAFRADGRPLGLPVYTVLVGGKEVRRVAPELRAASAPRSAWRPGDAVLTDDGPLYPA